MKYLKNQVTKSLIIQKSEFIANVFRVNSIEEANQIISTIKKRYYDAKHNCYAYVIGESMDVQKISDDGEPQGTAGLPILSVIKNNNITNVLVIVTRYFGGILLGKGGLIRAYGEAVSNALKEAELNIKILLHKFNLICDYSLYNIIKKSLDIKILDESFNENVNLSFACKDDIKDSIIIKLTDLSSGKVLLNDMGTLFEEIPLETEISRNN